MIRGKWIKIDKCVINWLDSCNAIEYISFMRATTKYSRFRSYSPITLERLKSEAKRLRKPASDKLLRRERQARKLAEERGYEVIQYGWPDMLLWREKDKKAVFLEVKARHGREGSSTLRPSQKRMHAVLKRLGLNVQVIWID